jgi:glutathione synthase/RimK-type ligase-like ATP-grasp enzyme
MTVSPVVIVGPLDDAHVVGVSQRVRALGAEPLLLDASRFPSSLRVTLGEDLDDVRIDGAHVCPAAVYVRNVGTGALHAASNAECDSAAERFQNWLVSRERADVLTAMLSRWEHNGVPVYNGLAASQRMTKPFQLALLKDAGLPVPATRWTNDSNEVRSFAVGTRVAYKPVSGGAATRELGADDLAPSRLELLNRAPVTFQGLLSGEDIRVYVLDGEVIAAIHIVTHALDFRGHEERCVRIELPMVVRQQCVRAAQVIGLRFTGMDLKRDAAGTLRFLELNSSPMFLGFDARAGTDIAGCLAARLVSWLPETSRASAHLPELALAVTLQ